MPESTTAQLNTKSPFVDLTRTGKPHALSIQSAGATIPFWGNSLTWDTVIFNGSTMLPGICTIKGNVKRRVQRKTATGRHAQTISYLGDAAAEFTIQLTLWTEKQLEDYVALVRNLKTLKPRKEGVRPKTSATIITVAHPALAIFKITQAHILKYTFLQAEADSDVYTAKMHCVEYIPEAIARQGGVSTPKADSQNKAGDLASIQTSIKRQAPSKTNTGPTP